MSFVKSVKEKYPQFFNNRSVVEIGSRNINGSVREFFYKCKYIGVDLEPGDCVDVVEDYRNYQSNSFLKERPETFDVVVSCEALEHDKYWITTLVRMYRALKRGGLLLITAAGDGRDEHGTWGNKPGDSPSTRDYYQNIGNEMAAELLEPKMFKTYYMNQCEINFDFQFYGIKA
jgi:SAM-dependent methyltransferase